MFFDDLWRSFSPWVDVEMRRFEGLVYERANGSDFYAIKSRSMARYEREQKRTIINFFSTFFMKNFRLHRRKQVSQSVIQSKKKLKFDGEKTTCGMESVEF